MWDISNERADELDRLATHWDIIEETARPTGLVGATTAFSSVRYLLFKSL
jgi:hypothetical protein